MGDHQGYTYVRYKLDNGAYRYKISKNGYITQEEDFFVRGSALTFEIFLKRDLGLKYNAQFKLNIDKQVNLKIIGPKPHTDLELIINNYSSESKIELYEGEYDFEIYRAGYREKSGELIVDNHKIREIIMEPVMYTLRFNFSPPDAHFIFDGTEYPNPPSNLVLQRQYGLYNYSLDKEGYWKDESVIIIDPSQDPQDEIHVNLSLDKEKILTVNLEEDYNFEIRNMDGMELEPFSVETVPKE